MATGHMAGEITELLAAWREGDQRALNQLFSLVYDELRAVARGQLRGPRPDGAIDTTALVHEAYLKLLGGSRGSLHDREHFFALAARAMRQILVDDARHRRAIKRGGDPPARDRVRLGDLDLRAPDRALEVLAVHEALTKLEKIEPRLGRVVEMRVFGGLGLDDIARVLDVSPRTVKRDWTKARAFLYLELGGPGRV